MTIMKKTVKLAVPALSLALGLGLAQPASAASGLVSTLTGTAQTALGDTLSGGNSKGSASMQGSLDGYLDGALKSAAALGVTGKGSAVAPNGGILAHATGMVDHSGKLTSLDVFGDDLVKVNLAKGRVSAGSKTGNAAAAGLKNVGLRESDANALMSQAINLKDIPQAKSVKVGDDGSIVLGANADGGKVKANGASKTSASAKAG